MSDQIGTPDAPATTPVFTLGSAATESPTATAAATPAAPDTPVAASAADPSPASSTAPASSASDEPDLKAIVARYKDQLHGLLGRDLERERRDAEERGAKRAEAERDQRERTLAEQRRWREMNPDEFHRNYWSAVDAQQRLDEVAWKAQQSAHEEWKEAFFDSLPAEEQQRLQQFAVDLAQQHPNDLKARRKGFAKELMATRLRHEGTVNLDDKLQEQQRHFDDQLNRLREELGSVASQSGPRPDTGEGRAAASRPTFRFADEVEAAFAAYRRGDSDLAVTPEDVLRARQALPYSYH